MVVLKEMLLTSIACASVIPSYLVILLVYVPVAYIPILHAHSEDSDCEQNSPPLTSSTQKCHQNLRDIPLMFSPPPPFDVGRLRL